VVRNTFVGAAAELDAPTRVENCTLLSTPQEPVSVRDGACLIDSLVQWGARVLGPAVVERAVLMEQSVVDRFGKVSNSLIGPNSVVGGAEVTASLVGPFVACHHQGMLIAARWPAGRGNVSYGAGVGCNHTSRAPDQEAVLGEGVFVGLGARIQYPIDLSQSPYTMVACGVTLPPQKVAFPFSLVRAAAEPIPGVPPGTNVLVPAWMLSENLYAVQRAALKFRARDRATRHRLEHEVFRPDVMGLVAAACERLERVSGKEVYTEREIPGLGRNVLFDRHRMAAARCYRAHLERLDLFRLLESGGGVALDRAETGFPEFPAGDRRAHEDGLGRLASLVEEFGLAVERSKARDEERGPLVIGDYADAHAPTADDPVVRQTWDEVRSIQAKITRVRNSYARNPGGRAPSALRVAGTGG
jgi:hypothetical protein